MNKHSKKTLIPFVALGAAISIAVGTTACGTHAASRGNADPVRGRYLVERVGMCQDCHSARDQKGAFVPEGWLAGAPLPFAPTVPMPWVGVSKPIAGLPTLDDAQAMAFLTTGELPGGRRALPPMPEFRFSAEDARDIVAYLRHPIAPGTPGDAAAAGAR
ncbi:MAG: hypothetical protein H6835_12080 [Planctomycetes bacterium]|nr:hypothetical protein [Planctomycetota bacterium]